MRNAIFGVMVVLASVAANASWVLAEVSPELTPRAAADQLGEAERARIERGAVVFETCASCHSLSADSEEPYFGPHLEGVLGRDVAADPNFQYTEALRSLGGVWNEDRLSRFLAGPRDLAPGTSMVQATKEPADVLAVIAFLRAVQRGQRSPDAVQEGAARNESASDS